VTAVQPGSRVATRIAVGAAAGAVLITTVVVANWATSHFGFIPVGFGQMATAGTFAAGFALVARDALQDAVGKRWMLVTLLLAAGLSYLVSDPHIATASAVAFLVSELLDFAVYTPIRHHSRLGDSRWAAAVIASGVVGAVVDTIVFIGIAFGAAAVLPAMAGQLIGKTYAAIVYLLIGRAVAVCCTSQIRPETDGCVTP